MNVEIKEEYGFKVLTPKNGYYITETTVESELERGFYSSISMPIDADESIYTEWTNAQKAAWERRYRPQSEEE